MKRLAAISLFLAVPTLAFAQTSLSDQINSVYSAQQQNDYAAQAAAQAQQREVLAEQHRQWATAREARAAAREAQRTQAAREMAREAAAQAAAEADKKRDQAYEDQLRALDIQEKILQLKADRAKVARANDYIDQDLNRSRAETDVIQSQADATRNISSGEKSFLNQAGRADIARVTGVVSN
jgi:Family of unknown function (DUF5384)